MQQLQNYAPGGVLRGSGGSAAAQLMAEMTLSGPGSQMSNGVAQAPGSARDAAAVAEQVVSGGAVVAGCSGGAGGTWLGESFLRGVGVGRRVWMGEEGKVGGWRGGGRVAMHYHGAVMRVSCHIHTFEPNACTPALA
eukprot:357723-Chlamydomonas_euryale.AAC.13